MKHTLLLLALLFAGCVILVKICTKKKTEPKRIVSGSNWSGSESGKTQSNSLTIILDEENADKLRAMIEIDRRLSIKDSVGDTIK